MTLSLDRSDWQKVKFGDVVRNVNDNVKDPAAAGIKRVLGLEHLEPGELRIQRWSDVSPESTFTRRARPGQTLFGKRRAYQRKTAYAEFDAVCSGDILVFESADPTRLLPELLPFIAMTDAFYAMALETSAGSLSPRTRWSDIAKYEFELPPLDQQRRIANLLWSLEAHRNSLAHQRSSLEQVARIWMDGEVQTHVRASSRTVGDCLDAETLRLLTGPFGTALSARAFTSGGVPVIHPANIRDSRVLADAESTVPASLLGSVQRWRVNPGDVVMMRKGDVGRSALVTPEEEGWVLSSDCISVRSLDHARLLPRYVQLVLAAPSQQAHLLRRAPGTTMPGINEKSLSPLAMPDVSLDVQKRFCEKYEALLVCVDLLARESEALLAMRSRLLDDLMEVHT